MLINEEQRIAKMIEKTIRQEIQINHNKPKEKDWKKMVELKSKTTPKAFLEDEAGLYHSELPEDKIKSPRVKNNQVFLEDEAGLHQLESPEDKMKSILRNSKPKQEKYLVKIFNQAQNHNRPQNSNTIKERTK